MTLHFVLNGEPTHVGAERAQTSLLAWLRASGRCGTKEGCAEGECGACAVALLQRDAHGNAQYRAVNSCLVPLACVAGQSVITVEGVAREGALHPVQEALIAHGGSQCGYCTPGFVVSMFCEFYRRERTSFDVEAVAGNLCRCTGYRPIVAAGRALPQVAPDDPRQVVLAVPPLPLTSVEHHDERGSFFRPCTLSELFRLWAAHPRAKLLAGATDLMVDVNQRDAQLGTLLSLEAIDELRCFQVSAHEITIGAALPLSDLELRLEAEPHAPALLRSLLPLFSSRLIRNRATLGGNLQTASPIGDAAPCLLALDAELSLSSAQGVRRLALSEFFVGYRKTALRPGELIACIHLPRPLPAVQRFYKVGKRPLDDISTVSAAFALDLGREQRVERLRIACGGVAATPLRVAAIERVALGRPWSRSTLEALQVELSAIAAPLSDHRGSAAYRRAMMVRLLEKFWLESQPSDRAHEESA
jgi:xanthine dehydrogenase small subunit